MRVRWHQEEEEEEEEEEADGGWWRPAGVRRSSITSVCDCSSSTPRRWDKARPSHVSVLSVRLCRRSNTEISFISASRHRNTPAPLLYFNSKVIKPDRLNAADDAVCSVCPSVSLSELNFFIQLHLFSFHFIWTGRVRIRGRSADDPTTTTTSHVFTGYRSIDQMIDHRTLHFLWCLMFLHSGAAVRLHPTSATFLPSWRQWCRSVV